MTDFEIQRRLREMNAPRLPDADLWAGIAGRIANEATGPAARRRAWPLAAAAALLLAVASGSVLIGTHQRSSSSDVATATGSPATSDARHVSPHAALDIGRSPGGDPRLVGAAVVLDSAHAELQQALEQRPDAVFLVSLLNRTNARRMKLDHFGANAG